MDEDKKRNEIEEMDESIERFIYKPEEIKFISEEESQRLEKEPGWTTIHLK